MQEVLGKIGFDWHLALVNIVNVFLIFLVLKKWAFGPIQRIIDQRKEQVDDKLAGASEAEKKLEKSREEAKEILKEAKLEAKKIVERAAGEGEGIIKDSHQKAAAEKDEILHKAKLELQSEKARLEKELKEKAAGLIAESVKKIMGSEVDSAMNERIIKKAKRLNV